MTALVVRRVGLQVLIEDAGRPGLAHLGVSPSGAADRASYLLANRLVGNADGAAGLEVLMGGLVLEPTHDVVVAVTGAPALVRAGGAAVALCTALRVRAGQTLEIGTPVAGLRTYVAVRGGLDVPTILGSRSSDPTSSLGPPPVRQGDHLAVGPPPTAPVSDEVGTPVSPPLGPIDLATVLGPRDDWLTEDALRLLGDAAWALTSESDRVGVRLSGPRLTRAARGELASEGLVRGAVQVPPSGQPVVFLADHPTTGGYPVVAVIDDDATDRLAQLRPGEQVRFTLQHASWLS
ncbi:biotin-dependent carboxyltransferase family protein [Luteipulveratus mongoliensis]|uniref:Allophanate hydrolase n=1 Tax=Luteipulveratus mongoliensis TaxID=571913 RepID=A0A0K1JM07_9MICO|nr:biotin-dependent carboxyltransferase family protein [Luteipulveratus mongoliensis]AKU17742.1 allophanate hydrolase [Luteipulveratus mongoliensis]